MEKDWNLMVLSCSKMTFEIAGKIIGKFSWVDIDSFVQQGKKHFVYHICETERKRNVPTYDFKPLSLNCSEKIMLTL